MKTAKGTKRLLAAAVAGLMLAACSSSKSGSSTGSGTTPSGQAASGSKTITIGLLTDLTGPAADAYLDTPKGVQAGIGVAANEGYHIRYVVADSATSPTGALTAAHKLVEQDHVFAVIAASALTFAAYKYLVNANVPIIGSETDGPEWLTTPNMFSVNGYTDFTKVYSTLGLFLKQQGVTTFGTVGIGVSPASSDAAKSSVISAQVAGLNVGYINANMPFGSTNVGPEVLAMKAAGVDGISPSLDQTTAFALISGLRQQGVHIKLALFPTGYGGDLQNSGPGAETTAKGVDFSTSWEPVEIHDAATQKFQAALKTYTGWTLDPTFGEYIGYLSVAALVDGLKAAGPSPTANAFDTAMLAMTHFDGDGLYGSHSISFAAPGRGQISGADNCEWMTQYNGSTFDLVNGADPICGALVPGRSIATGS